MSSIGTRFPALPLGPPAAEASLGALWAEQDVFPKERKAIIAKLRELQAMDEVFIGQGFSIGKGWTVIGLLDIIQEIAEKVAGINIRDMKTAGSDFMDKLPCWWNLMLADGEVVEDMGKKREAMIQKFGYQKEV